MGLTSLFCQGNTLKKCTSLFEVGDLVQYHTKQTGEGAWISSGSYGLILAMTYNSHLYGVAKIFWLDDSAVSYICCNYLRIVH